MKVSGCSCFQASAGLLFSFSQKYNLAEMNDLINYLVDFSFMLLSKPVMASRQLCRTICGKGLELTDHSVVLFLPFATKTPFCRS